MLHSMGTGISGRAPGVWLGVSCLFFAASFYFLLDVGNGVERRWNDFHKRLLVVTGIGKQGVCGRTLRNASSGGGEWRRVSV